MLSNRAERITSPPVSLVPRTQLHVLTDARTPTAHPHAIADQAAISYASQTISDPPTQTEVEAVIDGVVATVTFLNEIWAELVEKGRLKGEVSWSCLLCKPE